MHVRHALDCLFVMLCALSLLPRTDGTGDALRAMELSLSPSLFLLLLPEPVFVALVLAACCCCCCC